MKLYNTHIVLIHYINQNQKPIKQKGIALIQVLLISAILSVLALYLTSTAKSQVKIAQWSSDKAQALIEIENTEAVLIFNLLTQKRTIDSSSNITNSVSSKWNFFSKPFFIDKYTEIQLQDQTGLINAHFPQKKYLKLLIASLGYNSFKINHIVDSLLDWQDIDNIPRVNGAELSSYTSTIRNGSVPNLHDFKFVDGITPELEQVLLKNTTIYRMGSFNPTNSPEYLLKAITNNDAAEQVIELRNNNKLTKRNFTQITGIVEDDDVFFYPSNYFGIKLKSRVGSSIVEKKLVVDIQTYASGNKSPVNILSNRD